MAVPAPQLRSPAHVTTHQPHVISGIGTRLQGKGAHLEAQEHDMPKPSMGGEVVRGVERAVMEDAVICNGAVLRAPPVCLRPLVPPCRPSPPRLPSASHHTLSHKRTWRCIRRHVRIRRAWHSLTEPRRGAREEGPRREEGRAAGKGPGKKGRRGRERERERAGRKARRAGLRVGH
eukprot:3931850-Rhodomonas_salina.1